ncbi:acyl carrier protein [Streptomyces sp. NPDC050549]|uniref:acyl carrier protein n=1 Tax=Streptomyces sp. NPDC050549 TaxID=3155406 RepID=UPI00341823DD
MTTAQDDPSRRLGRLPHPTGLRDLPHDARARVIGHRLRLEVERMLAVPPAHRLSSRLPLCRQGLDALDALRLARVIRDDLGTEVPAETLRESTLDELAELLAR